MSKARELANLGNAYSDGALSNRNLIINGAMQVWQRGTSHSTSGYGSVDRWQQLNNTLLSRSTDVPTDEGFQYSSKVDFAGSADSNFVQNIENGIGLTSGKSVTLSFWAKATGTITRFENVYFINNTNFGVITAPAVSITNTWQRHTLTVTIPTYPAAQYSDVLQIRFDLDPLESGSYYITGVQLEVGDTATPFEHRSYGDELARCQRYFYRLYKTQAYQNIGNASMFDANNVYVTYQWPVVMRANPSVSLSSASDFNVTGNGSDLGATGYSVGHASPFNAQINLSRFGLTNGYAYWVRMAGGGEDASKFLQADAEL